MKWLFYITVLLNIAYFGYNISYNNTLILPQASVNNSSANSIVLLNEQNNEALQAGKEKTPAISQQEQKTEDTDSPQLAPPLQEVPDNSLQLEQQNNIPLITSLEVINKDSVAIAQVENSAASSSANIEDNNTTSIQTDKPEAEIKKICFKLGPFNKKELDNVKFTLEKLYSNKLSFGIETTSKITYYRIYIPPLESREHRKQALAHLDNNGMTDHYVMSIDGRKNAIALGVFKKREAAEKVAARANKLGFSTTIEAISDDKNSLYNLQLIFLADENLKELNTLVKQKQLKLTECRK